MAEIAPDPTPNAPAEGEVEQIGISATIASVLALVAAAVVAVGLLTLATLFSLCNLMGETCTSGEKTRGSLLVLAAGVVFFGIPALVARLRRDARWLYAPFVELIAAGTIATLALLF